MNESKSSESGLFITGTVLQLIVLLVISPVFTNWFSDNILLYSLLVTIITVSNFVIEKFSVSRKGSSTQDYMLFFISITIPINLVLIIGAQYIA